MKALTVIPATADSARLEEVPEPTRSKGEVLIQGHSVGICGTDREIIAGRYGQAPPGEERLILGHESLGRVLEAPESSELSKSQWVCSIVRKPDPVPCPNCARGEWDMCQNGLYTEHGIMGLHGFATERYCVEERFVVPVSAELAERGVLMEPASIVAKAWDHIERIGRRAYWSPERVLVTGAGPIGLLAALFAVQRGFEVHVFDRESEGPKPELVASLGASYHTGEVEKLAGADIILECTGASALVFAVMCAAQRNGIVCLAGVSSGGHRIPIDLGALNRALVLENNVVFGSVNANRQHYERAADALARANPEWLDRLITRHVPLDQWEEALVRKPGDVKTVISLERA